MSAGFAPGEWCESTLRSTSPTDVDVEARWRKSSHSNTEQDCVEVAQISTAIGIRDSKNPGGGHLTLNRDSFAGIVDRARAGDLDL